MDTRTTFQKELESLRELYNKGAEADPKKFHNLANSMVWDLHANFCLPLNAEQMEFIKLLHIAEAGGDYWHGVGWALTMFLVPLGKSPLPVNLIKPVQPATSPVGELKVPSSLSFENKLEDESKPGAAPAEENPKKPETPKGKFILD